MPGLVFGRDPLVAGGLSSALCGFLPRRLYLKADSIETYAAEFPADNVIASCSGREGNFGLELHSFISGPCLAPTTFNFQSKLHFRFAQHTIQIYQSSVPSLAGFPVSPVEKDLGTKGVSGKKGAWRETTRFGSK